MEVEFFVPGIPAAQPRHQVAVIGGKPRAYTPDKTGKLKRWKKAVAQVAGLKIKKPLAGAVDVRLTFLMPRPKSHYGTGRNANVLKNSAPNHSIAKPDVDNLAKAVYDALTGIAWHDDAQIVFAGIEKAYSNGETGCGITITSFGSDLFQQ